MLKHIVILIFIITSGHAIHKGMMNVSALDVEASLKFDIGQFKEDFALDSYYVGATAISTNDGKGYILGSLDFLLLEEMPIEGLKVGAGMRLIYTSLGSSIFIAFPLSVSAAYQVPSKNALPFFLTSELHYSPRILSVSDAINYFEFRAGMNYEVIENLKILLGYRIIQTNYTTSNVTYNNTVYIGMQAGF